MSDYQFNPNAEQWKEIIGFPGYEVSDHGSIRSYFTQGGKTLRKCKLTPQCYLKPCPIKNKSVRVSLWKNKIEHRMFISRLVLVAFIGPCPPNQEACHNDGNFMNNHLPNLRWDTHKANEHDKLLHGRRLMGETHHQAKLTEADVVFIRQSFAIKKVSTKELSVIYAVHQCTVQRIISGKLWKLSPGPITCLWRS